MNSLKGMSQILSLVVGAAILMMVAMLLMFSATDVIGGGVGDAQSDSCTNQIDSQCNVRASFQVPSQCVDLSSNQVGQQLYETDAMENTLDPNQNIPREAYVSCS